MGGAALATNLAASGAADHSKDVVGLALEQARAKVEKLQHRISKAILQTEAPSESAAAAGSGSPGHIYSCPGNSNSCPGGNSDCPGNSNNGGAARECGGGRGQELR